MHLKGTPIGLALALPSNSKTWLERVSKDKPSNLLGLDISDEGKKFYNVDNQVRMAADLLSAVKGHFKFSDIENDNWLFQVPISHGHKMSEFSIWKIGPVQGDQKI